MADHDGEDEMTEEEAKTKWCPMIRFTSAQSGLDSFENRGSACMCIASDCMMWQTTDNETFPTAPGEKEIESKPAGYCGLARR